MTSKSIFINAIFSFVLENIFLFLLVAVFTLRFVTYNFPSDKNTNFQTQVVLINPIQIRDSKILLFTSGSYRVITYSIPTNLQVGDTFTVKGYRSFQNIYANNIEITGKSRIHFLYKFKNYLIEKAQAYLPEPHSSLLNGILWGTKPDISDSFNNALILVGVIHIVVVSGYNLSVVFSLALGSFKKFGLKYASIVGVVLALIYSLVVGFDPPIIRALIMGLLMSIGKAWGQVTNILYILIVCIFVMLIFSPSLLFSVSFQLTVAATSGILVLGTPLNTILGARNWFSSLPKLLQEGFVASLAAQVFVIPLLLYYFKGVSWVGFIINPLILWLIPIIMFVGVVFLIFAALNIVPVAFALSYLLTACLTLVVDFINFFAAIPHNYMTVSFTVLHVFVLYVIIFILCVLLSRASKKYVSA